MHIVHVHVVVKDGMIDAFKAASITNAEASVATEPGVARFDVIQDRDEPTQFVLVEVYDTADDAAAHKETSHYLTWRDTVAEMMAQPRQAKFYKAVAPSTPRAWRESN